MTERQELLESIVNTCSDYRASELEAPTPEHVNRWVEQFNKPAQLPILREMNHALKKTYFPFSSVMKFLSTLLSQRKLVGEDAARFWRDAQFLDIQKGGNSQHEMLALLDGLLEKAFGFGMSACGHEATCFVYIDDAIFTGSRVFWDLKDWIENDAPQTCTLHVISIALHTGSEYYFTRIRQAARSAGKTITIKFWRAIELHDHKDQTDHSDVLRPVSIPDDARVKAYVENMRHKPILRRPGNAGPNGVFSSEEGRHLLEQEFLKAGALIREQSPMLSERQRPLGRMVLETLGFGSTIVTFRNCPNNAPLALWAGDPWYPLFPRTTNSQTEVRRLFESFHEGTGL